MERNYPNIVLMSRNYPNIVFMSRNYPNIVLMSWLVLIFLIIASIVAAPRAINIPVIVDGTTFDVEALPGNGS